MNKKIKNLDNESMFIVTRETCITAITGLRHYYDKLKKDEKRYFSDPDRTSMFYSVLKFKKIVERAYEELQKRTGDNTPIDINEG